MKDLNHSIDLFNRVVKVEARASCPRNAKPAHQRLVTMMSAPHGQPILIRERGEIVRMRCVHYKSYERAALFLWTKDASARQFADELGCISRKLRIVLENRRAPNVLDVINRGCESDRARDVWRASLEPVRRFLERAFFERDAHDHFAAAMADVLRSAPRPRV